MTTAAQRPPTWTAYETLPDGRERVLAEHLRYTAVLGARFPDTIWAIVWRRDPAPDSDDTENEWVQKSGDL